MTIPKSPKNKNMNADEEPKTRRKRIVESSSESDGSDCDEDGGGPYRARALWRVCAIDQAVRDDGLWHHCRFGGLLFHPAWRAPVPWSGGVHELAQNLDWPQSCGAVAENAPSVGLCVLNRVLRCHTADHSAHGREAPRRE